jgi:hypothetical protein
VLQDTGKESAVAGGGQILFLREHDIDDLAELVKLVDGSVVK